MATWRGRKYNATLRESGRKGYWTVSIYDVTNRLDGWYFQTSIYNPKENAKKEAEELALVLGITISQWFN